LLPNHEITVAKATVGTSPSSGWNAKLLVRPCTGSPYEKSAKSP
jgi:hypothetical protein